MRFGLCALVSALLVAPASAQIPSQTTQTGTVSKGTNKVFSFTSGAFGQISATLSWDIQGAHLVMVLVCGASEPITYGVAAGALDRVARFEAGLIGGEPCAVAVSSVDQTASFRLHLLRSADQSVAVAARSSGFVALTDAREGTLLADEAIRVLNRVREAVR